MKELTKMELLQVLQEYGQVNQYNNQFEQPDKQISNQQFDLQGIILRDMNLSDMVLCNINFSHSELYNICLDGADLSRCIMKNVLFENCTLCGAVLRDADLEASALRGADMTNCDIRGANLFCAVLEKAKLEGCISDGKTRFFKSYCPETGPFVGYKKCCDDRIVELLIPSDAKRTSATRNSCRCSKAKVMVIKSIDCSEYFEEAWSIVDENFVYRKGQWVEVPDFDADRWNDSTRGIHFWMSREDAIRY